MALGFSDGIDPIQSALDRYERVPAYQATLSVCSGGEAEIIRYSYRRPGTVRMDFVTPHRGAVLIYDPATGVAKLWPFGHRRFPVLSLSPSNPLIRSPSGQRVDRSDVGALFRNVQVLQGRGVTEVMGISRVGAGEALYVEVRADLDTVQSIAAYRLWLDLANAFPVKVSSVDRGGGIIETVEMAELRIGPEFPPDFFRQ